MRVPPTARVEIEFVRGLWTDVSDRWDAKRPISIVAGRTDAESRIAPGQMSGLRLDNTDGRFTVGNTTSPYYPDLASGKQIRISIKDPAAESVDYYLRYTGNIDGWSYEWADNGSTCWAVVNATDELLGLQAPADGWLKLYHHKLGAAAYWPFTDDRTDKHHEPGIGTVVMHPAADATLCTQAGPPADPALLPSGAVSAGWSATVVGTATGWTASMLFKAAAVPVAFVPLRVTDLATGNTVGLYVNDSGHPAVAYGGWTVGSPVLPVNICDGNYWILTLSGRNPGTPHIDITAYQVGADTVTGGSNGMDVSAAVALLDGGALRIEAGQYATALGHIAFYTHPGTKTIFPDTLCFEAIPADSAASALADISTLRGGAVINQSSVEPHTTMTSRPASSTWAGHVEQIENADRGILVADQSGALWYLQGAYRTRPPGGPTASIPITVTPDELSALSMSADRMKLINRATVRAIDHRGRVLYSAIAVDQESIDRSGDHAVDLDVYGFESGSTVIGAAWGLMSPVEVPRVPNVTIDAAALDITRQQALLNGDRDGVGWAAPVGIWSAIGITNLPTAGGMPDRWLGRIEGWTETLGIDVWSITFNISYIGNRLGDPTFGVLGSMRLG